MSVQKKGGWGSIFSGAVANLESRLDTILADDADASARERAAEQAAKESLASPTSSTFAESREASRSRVNDRLAERLARATQPKTPSRTWSPFEDKDDARVGEEQVADPNAGTTASEIEAKLHSVAKEAEERSEEAINAQENRTNGEEAPKSTMPDIGTLLVSRLPINPARVSVDSPRPSSDFLIEDTSSRPSLDVANGTSTPSKTQAELQAELDQMRSDNAETESQRREEMQLYLERIDALQAKLTYLAKESVAAAKEANASAGNSSDKALAEKDERIALLLQEGERLSKDEMRHLQTIKKLRAKGTEDERAATELKKKLDRVERSEADLKAKLRRAEVAERQAKEKAKQIAIIDKQVDELKEDRENAAELIRSLTTQLKEAKDRAAQAEKIGSEKASEVDKSRIATLENDLEDAQIEKKLAEEKAAAEVKKNKEEIEREQERFAVRELEYKTEISGLESRLEATRARAEEASSDTVGGSEGDSNVKLLRQVETLQQQYALAKGNWETIEGSLTARVATLEKERDEAHRRETEVRKKARDVGNRSRKTEEELESKIDQQKNLEQELKAQQEEVTLIQMRLQQMESTQTDAKAELERQRKIWESEAAQRLEEEKFKWRREAVTSPRNEMPPTFGRKGSGIGNIFSHKRQSSSRQISHHDIAALYSNPHATSRRPVAPPARQFTPTEPSPSMSRRESSLSLETQDAIPPTPSDEVGKHPIDEFEDNSSPERTINDIFSNSAASPGVGPSVQLVERMSALVRKLEAEKASFRDELSRLSSQRDDARSEVVDLMREVELKRAQDSRVSNLEKELGELKGRYEASLEMLGEREEEVEELKLDVTDMKKIYRELVEAKVDAPA